MRLLRASPDVTRWPAPLLALALLAATPSPSPSPTPTIAPAALDAITHSVARVGGVSIAYTARAGTISLHNAKEQLSARIFYVAYTKNGADRNHRPVTFFYNGGPGSSTVWLHMGSFGPVRVMTANGAPTGGPPFRLVPNDYSLIDKTDLVFVDAPNTGYSRVLGAGQPKDFMGVDQDARAYTQFIQRYITAFGRWNSPKFLFGESYGTTRDCVLVNMLQEAGVQMNGVVLLSSILNFGLGGGGRGPAIATGDWSFVFYLPTEAATAWYHRKASAHGLDLEQFLAGVERFALGQYAHALAQGADLPRAQYDDVVRKLHDYLGLSEEYIRSSNLRVPYPRFQQELLRDENTITGRYDSRFTTFDLDNTAERAPWDPSDVGIAGGFVSAFNRYVRESLHYSSDLQYRPVAYGGELGAPWDMHHGSDEPPANVAPDLAEALTKNPHLRAFSANGRYDFATPYLATVYTLTHLGLAAPLQNHISFGFYPSGHMVYLNPAAIGPFKSDLARWYDDTLNSR
jgi:carboxypeptidase C (cathepsin A)